MTAVRWSEALRISLSFFQSALPSVWMTGRKRANAITAIDRHKWWAFGEIKLQKIVDCYLHLVSWGYLQIFFCNTIQAQQEDLIPSSSTSCKTSCTTFFSPQIAQKFEMSLAYLVQQTLQHYAKTISLVEDSIIKLYTGITIKSSKCKLMRIHLSHVKEHGRKFFNL